MGMKEILLTFFNLLFRWFLIAGKWTQAPALTRTRRGCEAARVRLTHRCDRWQAIKCVKKKNLEYIFRAIEYRKTLFLLLSFSSTFCESKSASKSQSRTRRLNKPTDRPTSLKERVRRSNSLGRRPHSQFREEGEESDLEAKAKELLSRYKLHFRLRVRRKS